MTEWQDPQQRRPPTCTSHPLLVYACSFPQVSRIPFIYIPQKCLSSWSWLGIANRYMFLKWCLHIWQGHASDDHQKPITCCRIAVPSLREFCSGYPEDYFRRQPLPDEVILRLINTIRADDIYGQQTFLPAPEHRTTALSAQVTFNSEAKTVWWI